MKYIDLTMPINEKTPVYPEYSYGAFARGKDTKDGFAKYIFTMDNHLGTHIDFPLHFIEGGKNLSDYSLSHLIGECKVLDISKTQDINLEDVKKSDIVFLYTGHSDKLYCKSYFPKTPGLSVELAQRLLEKGVKIVGMDFWSPDLDKVSYPVHNMLLSNEILIVENLVNLKGLIGKKVKVYIIPIKLDKFDGAPCRIFAEIF